MAIKRQAHAVVQTSIDVIEKKPDADAAIGGGQHFAYQHSPGQIVLPVIILQIETAARLARRHGPERKGIHIVGDQRNAVEAPVFVQHRR